MKKKIIYLSFILVLVISLITLSSIYKSKDNKYKKEYNTIPKGMAIMIKEEGATDYIKSTSKDIPKGNYVLNRDKSYCKNNGKIGNYDSSLGKISFSFIGTDSCYLYFDVITDNEKPVISNLKINGKTITATLTDNQSLLAYGFSTSNTIEPTSWTTISGKTYNLSTTINTGGTYYLWVKDSVGNKEVSSKIVLEDIGWKTILANNEVHETTPDFTKNATTNEGLYKAPDDLGTSYYFRGAVDNNWVKFGKDSSGKDIYWRIIRINGDGSIRMIYTGTTAPTSSTSVVMTGTGTQIGTSKFNSSIAKAEYVGYQYIIGQQHGYGKCNGTSASCTVNENTVYNSTIKQAIDNWYKTTTLETDSATKSLVADQIFCNDRSPSSTQTTAWKSTGVAYYYGAYGRLDSNKTPILTCPIASDKFTVNTSNGNGALTYPVGLITADEAAMAGGVTNYNNKSYYLYTNQSYWSGSPSRFDSGGTNGFFVDISFLFVDTSYGVRPVISLSSKVKLSGSGTYNDVYTVVEGNSTENTSSGKSFDTVFAANNTDIFSENGIRYEGADPNNYICLDNKTSGACSSSSLLFRIIGLFDEDTSTDGTSSSGTKKLLKVIDTNNYGGTSGKNWNSANLNNWSNASLKKELNEAYLTTLLGTSNVNSKLKTVNTAIVSAKWHLGGGSSANYKTLTAEGVYREERNTKAIYSGNPESIFAKVGLMYPSDYGYATVGGSTTNKAGCRAQALYNWNSSSYSDCKNNDWVFKSAIFVMDAEWLLSPYSSRSYSAAVLDSSGYVHLSGSSVGSEGFLAVRPTFYLDSSILKIVGTGDGTSSNPYRIG